MFFLTDIISLSYRVSKDMGHEKDFLTVGSMGHTSTIALGVAMQKPKRQVFCLDGDGSVIMHMGAMATVGQSNLENFKHIVINNGAHDSVGGQPTDAGNHEDFSFSKIAQGCGYKTVSIILSKIVYIIFESDHLISMFLL